ncbi:cytochrome c3 family protein [Roseomonas chloroacetimidivorans]|uniref:cytochrome c3 family protein n=1 Tax=Roseomonas chloroacetimidivorans TaxID=1766656 RepID=UPI003C742CF6
MKVATAIYLVLAVLGTAAAVLVPLEMYRSGPSALASWRAAVVPGPLSAAHSFLDAQCESCHTPDRGVEAASCVTCHATAASELLPKPSTAFHGYIGECAGCHVEHQGRDRRPVNMDHSVLAAVGHAQAAEAEARNSPTREASFRHALAKLQGLLSGSGADLVGRPLDRRSLPGRTAASLDCAGCHANHDPHQTLFGRDCQSCHNTAAWVIAAFRHPSPRSRDCVQCHQAPPSHYMMHFMMLGMMTGQTHARVEQCFLCHQTDSWNNIKGVGWLDMH